MWSVVVLLLSFLMQLVSSEKEILVVVLASKSTFNQNRSIQIKDDLEQQYQKYKSDEKVFVPRLMLLSEEDVKGAWTIIPIINKLNCEENCIGVLFVDDNVEINLSFFSKRLSSLPLSEDLFVGRVLYDSYPSIIHHFSTTNFTFPHPSFGFFLSHSILSKLITIPNKLSFSIDPYYEFALYVHDVANVSLTHVQWCTEEACAIKIKQALPQCEDFQVQNENIMVAVKTCEKYHKKRLPTLMSTWGNDVKNLVLFSDKEDEQFNTIYVGTPNTQSGHCKKLMLILKHAHQKLMQQQSLQWIVVADDDTLISMDRLLSLLRCYNSKEVIFLGERYGYGVVNGVGYDYITLGGGMLVSRAGLEKLMEMGGCQCGSDDSPDDMTLGMCLQHHQIPCIHSPHFHQASPPDYVTALIKELTPVTFHRHHGSGTEWMYRRWLMGEEEEEGEVVMHDIDDLVYDDNDDVDQEAVKNDEL